MPAFDRCSSFGEIRKIGVGHFAIECIFPTYRPHGTKPFVGNNFRVVPSIQNLIAYFAVAKRRLLNGGTWFWQSQEFRKTFFSHGAFYPQVRWSLKSKRQVPALGLPWRAMAFHFSPLLLGRADEDTTEMYTSSLTHKIIQDSSEQKVSRALVASTDHAANRVLS